MNYVSCPDDNKICPEGVLINFGGIWTLNPSAYFLPLDYPRTSKIHQTVVSGPEFFCLIHFAYSRPSLTPTAALLLASSFRAPSTSTRLSTVAQLLATPPPLSLSLSLSLSLVRFRSLSRGLARSRTAARALLSGDWRGR
jgi:hypothetical protein